MKNQDFYDILDSELNSVISEDIGDELLLRLKTDSQKKSYALMIWFIKFYSEIIDVCEYITDGNEDNSCDIILDSYDSQKQKTFYLVQSKWNSKNNCLGDVDKLEARSFFSDVHSVLKGDKGLTKNERFNVRYEALKDHMKHNGAVKVIFLSLKNQCKDIDANILSLERSIGGKIKVEVFDINRIKKDYIYRNYKKGIPPNPLEQVYSPEYELITIKLVRDKKSEDNHIQVTSPFEAHVFTVRPSFIYDLVERYGVSLFDKNIRNPLKSSSINNEIKQSLIGNPSYFWYYNNGITAITKKIPEIGRQAESFDVTGIQIINGAQTAYSIYKAIKECSEDEKNVIDDAARITFRLLKSGGKDFDLKVTKYTNSQNPVSDRDFWSGDEIQEKIQDYFLKTNVWYERRDGEFRVRPKGVTIVPNSYVANAYLAFILDDPCSVFEASYRRETEEIDIIFTSHKEHQDGLYERIFNNSTDPRDLYASFCIFDVITDNQIFPYNMMFYSHGFHIISLSKIVLQKYLYLKHGSIDINLIEHVIRSYDQDDINHIRKCLTFTIQFFNSSIGNDKKPKKRRKSSKTDSTEEPFDMKLLMKKSFFDGLIEKLTSYQLTLEEIDSIPIKLLDFEQPNKNT